jgi:hypothetical protein
MGELLISNPNPPLSLSGLDNQPTHESHTDIKSIYVWSDMHFFSDALALLKGTKHFILVLFGIPVLECQNNFIF